MRILSVDTSGNVATAAICEDEKLDCQFVLNNKLTHSHTLMPIIDSVLKQSELNLKDIDLLAVSYGPGSFTGLRIGVSAVKGLAHATKIPVVGVSTLEAMAYNLPFCEFLICPIMDARRAEVYNAIYKWEKTELVEIKAPRAISVDELCEELLKMGEKVVFLGDGVPVYKDIILEKLADWTLFAPFSANAQRASCVAVAAKKEYEKNGAKSGFDLAPVYLRKSQAEREAEEKEKNK